MLNHAVVPRSGVAWPANESSEPTLWQFWPRLLPGEGGLNSRFVEPDVVLITTKTVVLFEAKHHGHQAASQWREQVLAARRAWPGRVVVVVAVGGGSPSEDQTRVQALGMSLEGGPVPVFRLTWDAMRQQAHRAAADAKKSHDRRVLRDIRDAIIHWGYRSLIPFHTLAEARETIVGSNQIDDLALHAALRDAVAPSSRRTSQMADLVALAPRFRPQTELALHHWNLK